MALDAAVLFGHEDRDPHATDKRLNFTHQLVEDRWQRTTSRHFVEESCMRLKQDSGRVLLQYFSYVYCMNTAR